MKNVQVLSLGEFEVTGGKLIMSDPCYERGTWCAKELDNVKDGKWIASIERADTSWDRRTTKLVAHHVEHDAKAVIIAQSTSLGVDSGQMGIFCASKYQIDGRGEYEDKESFYGGICEANKNGSAIVDAGCVSDAGFGDGSYPFSVATTDGKVTYVEVIFISEEDENELNGD